MGNEQPFNPPPQQCPYCSRWFTPSQGGQITCGRLKCQAARAKELRLVREAKPLDPKIVRARALKREQRRREAIRSEAERLAMGMYLDHACCAPSIIDECPFL